MRLIPESLYGRLLAILLIGLMVPQLLSALVHLYDRDTVLHQTMGAGSAERIGSIVELLDPMTDIEREKMVEALNGFPLEVVLTSKYIKFHKQKEVENEQLYLLFKEYLQKSLPPGHEAHVEVVETVIPVAVGYEDMNGPHTGMREMMSHRMRMQNMWGMEQQKVKSFHVQVRLSDGVWVDFHYHIPKKVFAWPTRMVVALSLLLFSVLILTWIAVRWVTRPLSLLSDAAEALGKDIRRSPLEINGPKEVRQAAEAFNTMQQRLSRYIGDRARILSAVSHDLKTPITRLRLRSEMLEDDRIRADIETDLDHMEEMVVSTLDFMRGTENPEPMQQIDMQALLESLQEDLEPLGIRFDIKGQVTEPIRGRLVQLKRCLTNLLENGTRHGGGRVWVKLDELDDRLLIVVNSDGATIPAEELEKVFEPFYRVEKSRSRESGGTGLGLSIARNIARAHGGELILKNRPEGGVAAELEIPRS
ncbi:MAG: HAMP domain-containing protein [Gammaproteobacteria bacterium]|uniref:histidine kinase n=1 Tax=Candidatus Thiopontia autotrophica TaxID=2841688 RepID=A0A8J6TXP2_9GAMM|nr:HAMP domain-containing protein [Candidatus Thiopontia autotrophica]MBL6969070.1 HAMP domain-containing protein [Gammaproteobacteria bacterium]